MALDQRVIFQGVATGPGAVSAVGLTKLECKEALGQPAMYCISYVVDLLLDISCASLRFFLTGRLVVRFLLASRGRHRGLVENVQPCVQDEKDFRAT